MHSHSKKRRVMDAAPDKAPCKFLTARAYSPARGWILQTKRSGIVPYKTARNILTALCRGGFHIRPWLSPRRAIRKNTAEEEPMPYESQGRYKTNPHHVGAIHESTAKNNTYPPRGRKLPTERQSCNKTTPPNSHKIKNQGFFGILTSFQE